MVSGGKNPNRKNPTTFKWKNIIFWFLLSIWVILISLWVFVAWFTIEPFLYKSYLPPVQVILSAPNYISVDEDAEIRFAVSNVKGQDVHVSFQLMYEGSFLAFLGLEGSNVIYSGPVLSQKQLNRQIKVFYPRQDGILGTGAGLSLWGSIDNAPLQEIADLKIGIAPISRSTWLRNNIGILVVGLTSWLLNKLWDQIKEPVTKTKK